MATETKRITHTPGPWTFRVERDAEEGISSARFFIDGPAGSSRGRWVLAETKALPPRGTDEAEANARLIAAAPDLLMALKQITNEMQSASSRGRDVSVGWMDLRIETARAAIAKAEEGSR